MAPHRGHHILISGILSSKRFELWISVFLSHHPLHRRRQRKHFGDQRGWWERWRCKEEREKRGGIHLPISPWALAGGRLYPLKVFRPRVRGAQNRHRHHDSERWRGCYCPTLTWLSLFPLETCSFPWTWSWRWAKWRTQGAGRPRRCFHFGSTSGSSRPIRSTWRLRSETELYPALVP